MNAQSEKLWSSVQELKNAIDECERIQRCQADKELLAELEKAIGHTRG